MRNNGYEATDHRLTHLTDRRVWWTHSHGEHSRALFALRAPTYTRWRRPALHASTIPHPIVRPHPARTQQQEQHNGPDESAAAGGADRRS